LKQLADHRLQNDRKSVSDVLLVQVSQTFFLVYTLKNSEIKIYVQEIDFYFSTSKPYNESSDKNGFGRKKYC